MAGEMAKMGTQFFRETIAKMKADCHKNTHAKLYPGILTPTLPIFLQVIKFKTNAATFLEQIFERLAIRSYIIN